MMKGSNLGHNRASSELNGGRAGGVARSASRFLYLLPKLARPITCASLLTISAVFPHSAIAGFCALGNHQYKVIDEYWKLPNYHQGNYGGPNDCAPKTASMMLTYFDAKGTPGIINNPLQSNGVNPQVLQLMEDLYEALPYSESSGTWDLAVIFGFGSLGEDIKDVAQARTPNANNWSTAESGIVDFETIGWHMDNDNPVMLNVRWPGNTFYGGEYGGDDVSYHFMPIFARYYRKWGWKNWLLTFGGCWDSYAIDAEFVAVRTSWVQHPSNDYSWLDYNEFSDWYYVRIDDKVDH